MGSSWSSTVEESSMSEDEKFIIVPPVMTTDREEVDRFSTSSYDWFHSRRSLELLMRKHLDPGATVDVHVGPSQDMLLSAVTTLPQLTWNNLIHLPRAQGQQVDVWTPRSGFGIRKQLGNPYSFAKIHYSQLKACSRSQPARTSFAAQSKLYLQPLHGLC
jgi:hypothetical protein